MARGKGKKNKKQASKCPRHARANERVTMHAFRHRVPPSGSSHCMSSNDLCPSCNGEIMEATSRVPLPPRQVSSCAHSHSHPASAPSCSKVPMPGRGTTGNDRNVKQGQEFKKMRSINDSNNKTGLDGDQKIREEIAGIRRKLQIIEYRSTCLQRVILVNPKCTIGVLDLIDEKTRSELHGICKKAIGLAWKSSKNVTQLLELDNKKDLSELSKLHEICDEAISAIRGAHQTLSDTTTTVDPQKLRELEWAAADPSYLTSRAVSGLETVDSINHWNTTSCFDDASLEGYNSYDECSDDDQDNTSSGSDNSDDESSIFVSSMNVEFSEDSRSDSELDEIHEEIQYRRGIRVFEATNKDKIMNLVFGEKASLFSAIAAAVSENPDDLDEEKMLKLYHRLMTDLGEFQKEAYTQNFEEFKAEVQNRRKEIKLTTKPTLQTFAEAHFEYVNVQNKYWLKVLGGVGKARVCKQRTYKKALKARAEVALQLQEMAKLYILLSKDLDKFKHKLLNECDFHHIFREVVCDGKWTLENLLNVDEDEALAGTQILRKRMYMIIMYKDYLINLMKQKKSIVKCLMNVDKAELLAEIHFFLDMERIAFSSLRKLISDNFKQLKKSFPWGAENLHYTCRQIITATNEMVNVRVIDDSNVAFFEDRPQSSFEGMCEDCLRANKKWDESRTELAELFPMILINYLKDPDTVTYGEVTKAVKRCTEITSQYGYSFMISIHHFKETVDNPEFYLSSDASRVDAHWYDCGTPRRAKLNISIIRKGSEVPGGNASVISNCVIERSIADLFKRSLA